MTENGFPADRRHLERYAAITRTIYRYGFTDLALSLITRKGLKLEEKDLVRDPGAAEKSFGKRFRLALEDLGPGFIKLGQLLSNRPDVLPREVVTELEVLQDNAPPFPFAEVKKIVEEELGRPLSQLYHYFEETPYAAASLAQVHKAVLRTGETVAVKVQRPDITGVITTDLEILAYIAGTIQDRSDKMKFLNPSGLVRTFHETIMRELDYSFEALNMERFRKNFRNDPRVRVPVVFRDLSTSRVLTMEFVDGIKVNNPEGMKGMGIDPVKVAEAGTGAFFTQVFEHGFFHADPHPGNILVLTDGTICYLDFGMMGMLLPEIKDQVTSLFIGIDSQDPRRIIRALKNLSHTHRFEDEEKLRYRISELVEYYSITTLGNLSLAELLNSFRDLFVTYKINIPSELFLLIKAFTITEGLGLALNPEMNVVEELRPHIRRIIRKKFTPSGLSRSFYLAAIDSTEFIRDLPSDLKDIIDKIRYGKLHVEIEHKGLDDFGDKLLQVSNRVSFSILTASLVIGSAVLVLSGVPPVYNGVPLPGVAGFLISGVFAVRLLLGIWKKGKL